MSLSAEAPPVDDPEQVQKKKACSNCNHPISFHGNGLTGCRAMGCKCTSWADEDGFESKEHYGVIVNLMRAMEVSCSMRLLKGQPLIYVGESLDAEGRMDNPAFAVWSNHRRSIEDRGDWSYSVIDHEGLVVATGNEVMPHDTVPEEAARIIAQWTYPSEEHP